MTSLYAVRERAEPLQGAGNMIDRAELLSDPKDGPGMTKKSSHREQIGCEGAK